ncbi:MAG: macrocin O-methyltransferase, partial [Deltaproteobacteria bacterium]|nr:macrocin O-methyltransferase [Deltaproteobacteria bacterium]
MRQVSRYTMAGPEALHALIESTRYIVANNIPGDIVECGVWKGGGMMATM